MRRLRLLSGGAAQGLVGALAPDFEAETGIAIEGRFGAVGAMREALEAGAPADFVILTAALVRELGAAGLVLAEEAVDLGPVATAVAVRDGDDTPEVGNGEALRGALEAADAIYLPDPVKATAGIHVAAVLARLGLAATLAERLRPFPNGATAMRELARSDARRPIGCTQATEILATEGVRLVAPLPAGFDLATVYIAAPCREAAEPEAARELIRRLAAPGAAGLRAQAGFGPRADAA